MTVAAAARQWNPMMSEPACVPDTQLPSWTIHRGRSQRDRCGKDATQRTTACCRDGNGQRGGEREEQSREGPFAQQHGATGGRAIKNLQDPKTPKRECYVQATDCAGHDGYVHGLSIRLAAADRRGTAGLPEWILWTVLAANAVDWIETILGVRWFGGYELMRTMRWWLAHWGIVGVTVWKAAVGALLYSIWRLGGNAGRWRGVDLSLARAAAWILLVLMGVALWGVALANLMVLWSLAARR